MGLDLTRRGYRPHGCRPTPRREARRDRDRALHHGRRAAWTWPIIRQILGYQGAPRASPRTSGLAAGYGVGAWGWTGASQGPPCSDAARDVGSVAAPSRGGAPVCVELRGRILIGGAGAEA